MIVSKRDKREKALPGVSELTTVEVPSLNEGATYSRRRQDVHNHDENTLCDRSCARADVNSCGKLVDVRHVSDATPITSPTRRLASCRARSVVAFEA